MDRLVGFQHLKEPVHKFVSHKGGRVRVPKGFAKMPKDRLKEVTSKGGYAKAQIQKQVREENSRKSLTYEDIIRLRNGEN